MEDENMELCFVTFVSERLNKTLVNMEKNDTAFIKQKLKLGEMKEELLRKIGKDYEDELEDLLSQECNVNLYYDTKYYQLGIFDVLRFLFKYSSISD